MLSRSAALGFAFAFGMSVSACNRAAAVPDPVGRAASDCPAADLEQALAAAPSAQVIVLLQADREGAEARQGALLAELGADFELARSYASLPGFAGTITRHGYERARSHRDVRCIQLDHPGHGG